MLLPTPSNLLTVHTTGTNLTVADTLSRDFSNITSKTCQLQQKTIPPHIDFTQLQPSKSLK